MSAPQVDTVPTARAPVQSSALRFELWKLLAVTEWFAWSLSEANIAAGLPGSLGDRAVAVQLERLLREVLALTDYLRLALDREGPKL